MKLNRPTMFEWKRHAQESTDVTCYSKILEFIDLWARASEMVLCEGPKCHSQLVCCKTYVTNVDTACMPCSVGKALFLYPQGIWINVTWKKPSRVKINPSFVSTACSQVLSCRNVPLIRRAKNVVSHTIPCCIYSLSMTARGGQLVEILNGQLKQMTLP